jgi:Glyoxalase-like domain
VVDEHEAHESVLGDRVATWTAAGGGPMGWAVRPLDLDATAARLGLGIGRGSRTTLSGERIEWRSAGLDEAMRRPWLPFFIDWGDTASFPGAIAEAVASITRLELEGDVQELSTWLGDHSLPVEPRAGTAGVTSIILDGPRGPVTLDRAGR